MPSLENINLYKSLIKIVSNTLELEKETCCYFAIFSAILYISPSCHSTFEDLVSKDNNLVGAEVNFWKFRTKIKVEIQ